MKNDAQVHERFMRESFRLALKGKGFVSPNPLVGAVLVDRGQVVARGYHKQFGGAHAEVECLRQYKGSLARAVLYVNLEPCSYYGKTPPCSDLLIQRGVKHVVIAMNDPNPLVAGKGISKLRRAGIRVTLGVLEEEARHLNRFFARHIITKLPYVHLKIAQTIDGFIAKRKGALQYVTSLPSRRLVHHWRTQYDAALVGAGTIRADNPHFNVRLAKGRDPAVVILDGRLRLSGREKVFSTARERNVFLCVSSKAIASQRRKVNYLEKRGVIMLPFRSRTGNLNLEQILRELYRRNVGSILVEGGSAVFTDFTRQNLVDEVSVFYSPKTFGTGVPVFSDGGRCAHKLTELLLENRISSYRSGADILLTGIIH